MERAKSVLATRLSALRWLSRTAYPLIAVWVLLLGTFAIVSLRAERGWALTAFGDLGMCVVCLFATCGLLLNIKGAGHRARAFWALLAAGCATCFVSQLIWAYFEVVLRQTAPHPFWGDGILFLEAVPMIAALAFRPDGRHYDLNLRVRYIDLSMLVLWWVYVYVFSVIPWHYITSNVQAYDLAYWRLAAAENFLLVVGFGSLLIGARGKWREIHAHLFSASLVYAAGSLILSQATGARAYYSGSPADLVVFASFLWFGTAGITACRLKRNREELTRAANPDSHWPSRFAMIAVFSIPAMCLWSIWFSRNPHAIRIFRIEVGQVTLIAAATMVFMRQRLVNRDRLRLVRSSQDALEDLKRFQQQMVQNEKLVSIGQLAAGAAHEINNPLTGILGYSDLLAEDEDLSERQRATAEKIRALSRRIKTLVTSLLSFARRVPPEKGLLDLNEVIATALNLNNLGLRDKKIEIEILPDPDLPPVHGDANQLLQVCFNLMSNAVDALEQVGGGKLVIRTDHDSGRAILEFSDDGPGMSSPQQVFDPFFTTKPVGKGTGLGLSICYGIMQEHGGGISCWNRPEGGATFRVEFPTTSDATPSPPSDAFSTKMS